MTLTLFYLATFFVEASNFLQRANFLFLLLTLCFIELLKVSLEELETRLRLLAVQIQKFEREK